MLSGLSTSPNGDDTCSFKIGREHRREGHGGLYQLEGISGLKVSYARKRKGTCFLSALSHGAKQRDLALSGLRSLSASKQRQSALLINDAFPNSVEHELRRIMQVQFLQDVAAMSLDGVGANVESCCYFLVRLPFGQKL